MKGFTYPDQCKKCPFLPTCSNCRADALAKTGDLFGANSYREQYERTVPELIKAHYDLQIRRGKGVIHDGETRADVGRH